MSCIKDIDGCLQSRLKIGWAYHGAHTLALKFPHIPWNAAKAAQKRNRNSRADAVTVVSSHVNVSLTRPTCGAHDSLACNTHYRIIDLICCRRLKKQKARGEHKATLSWSARVYSWYRWHLSHAGGKKIKSQRSDRLHVGICATCSFLTKWHTLTTCNQTVGRAVELLMSLSVNTVDCSE